jgi:hypothetical protein
MMRMKMKMKASIENWDSDIDEMNKFAVRFYTRSKKQCAKL